MFNQLNKNDIYMSSFNDRLVEAMHQKRIKQVHIKSELGVSKGTVSNWVSGKTTPENATTFTSLAKFLGVSSDWLATGEGEMIPNPKRDGIPVDELEVSKIEGWDDSTKIDNDIAAIPFYKNTEFRGGDGAFELPSYEERKLMFSKRSLKSMGADPACCFASVLRGKSMMSGSPEVESIADGATCVYDRSKTKIVDDEIYAFMHDGLFRVKRLRRLPGNKLALISNNPDKTEFPTEELSQEQVEDPNYFEIIGWLADYSKSRKWKG